MSARQQPPASKPKAPASRRKPTPAPLEIEERLATVARPHSLAARLDARDALELRVAYGRGECPRKLAREFGQPAELILRTLGLDPAAAAEAR